MPSREKGRSRRSVNKSHLKHAVQRPDKERRWLLGDVKDADFCAELGLFFCGAAEFDLGLSTGDIDPAIAVTLVGFGFVVLSALLIGGASGGISTAGLSGGGGFFDGFFFAVGLSDLDEEFGGVGGGGGQRDGTEAVDDRACEAEKGFFKAFVVAADGVPLLIDRGRGRKGTDHFKETEAWAGFGIFGGASTTAAGGGGEPAATASGIAAFDVFLAPTLGVDQIGISGSFVDLRIADDPGNNGGAV